METLRQQWNISLQVELSESPGLAFPPSRRGQTLTVDSFKDAREVDPPIRAVARHRLGHSD